MTALRTPVLRFEARKLRAAPVARIGAAALLALVVCTGVGGYAAAVHAPDSDMGRKAAAMLAAPGWEGYTGLASLSVGVAMLLAAGIVMAWATGREFTDGTIGGLFALPAGRADVATAKVVTCLGWVVGVATAAAVLLASGGVALGLPAGGWLACAGVLFVTAALLGASALPVMWVSTRWRGYLPGIGATLALVVVTNVASGFGLGAFLPWAIPVLWATPHAGVDAALLALPVLVAVAGGLATRWSWGRLQLGDR